MMDIEMMIKLLKRSSTLMGNLNGDAITSLTEMIPLKVSIDDLINKIEREEV
tara:strand:+ start:72 stop:227 length:156 start_codon:yes stop_codon:yes gene_type:complete